MKIFNFMALVFILSVLAGTCDAREKKCFVILGLRLAFLPQVGKCLSHEDVEPTEMLPVKKSNG